MRGRHVGGGGGRGGGGGGGAHGDAAPTGEALQALAAHVVVLLPVLVLAEGAAVARRVAAATCLARLAPAVPATLRDGKEREGAGEKEKDRIQYEYLTVTKMK